MARKTKNLNQRDTFIIITNGKETEKNYFSALRGYRRSIYEVNVEFENSDPIGLVNRAAREKLPSNRVWIVFDKDEFSPDVVYESLRIARRNDIGVAFSNMAFEVWLIDHFEEFSKEKNAEELVAILDELLKKHGYSKGYEKNDVDSFKKVLFPALDDAVHNADVSLQKRIAGFNEDRPGENNYPYCEWNSCTTVHKLIEAMKLETK